MSVDLTTHYLGIKLRGPLGVASCPPLTGSVDTLLRLEDAGASIVVAPSLFEEQIVHDELELDRLFEFQADSFAESLDYFPEPIDYKTGPREYLKHIESAKDRLSIPVVGSLNGESTGGWVHYAKEICDAGADALELNIYHVPTDPTQSAADVEQRYVDLVSAVRAVTAKPLAVKVPPQFSALPHFAHQLASAGANGLVLFNRMVEADVDLEELEIKPDLVLSTRHEMRTPLRWISILSDQLDVSLAATSGVHTWQSALKLLLAGADVAMAASVLLMKGADHLAAMIDDVRRWMEEHEYESVEQLKGSMSRANCPDPSALERGNYMKALNTFATDYVVNYAVSRWKSAKPGA